MSSCIETHGLLDIKPFTTPSKHLARNNSLAIDIHNLRIFKLATIGHGLLGTDGIAHFAPRIPGYIPQVFERAGIAYPRPETGNSLNNSNLLLTKQRWKTVQYHVLWICLF